MIPRTEGIVLKSFDFRETSRIATFFSKDYGKFTGVLKGIRTNSKKFGSNIDRFSINDIVFYRYTRSELHLISHCDLKQYFFPIRQDYKRNVAANYILELVDMVMPIEEPNKRIYRLILAFLDSLESTDDIDKLVYIFQIKTLLFSGFRPHIDSCVKCHKKIHERARFSMRSGGFICTRCPTSETEFIAIAKGTVASILHIERNQWQQCLRLGLTPPVRKELKYILNNFLIYHLGKKVKAAKYL